MTADLWIHDKLVQGLRSVSRKVTPGEMKKERKFDFGMISTSDTVSTDSGAAGAWYT